jgi:hypothetical protein
METEPIEVNPARRIEPPRGHSALPKKDTDTGGASDPADKYEEWEDLIKEARKDVEGAIDAKFGFTKQEADWFAEGDRPYSEEPVELKDGEGFTEQDKKWFAEGDKPWEGEDGEPSDGAPGAARR